MSAQSIRQLSPRDSMKFARQYMKKNLRAFKREDFALGRLLFLKYNAKDKTKVYEKNPLILVLMRNSRHTLGLNFHWVPYNMRIELVNFILKLNESRVNNYKRLKFPYPVLKKFLKKRGFVPCVRKYINQRFSRSGVVIPNTRLLGFARLNMMIFSNGLTAEQAYRLAIRKQI